MPFWNAIKNEFIDIIEWTSNEQDVMVYRYPRSDNEIKHGAKLVVREGQVAVFVNEGRAHRHIDMEIFEPADVFEPGTYTLETKNLPVLSKLQGWKYGFESPFKAEVYFFNTTRLTNQKWGTPNPIMLRDPEFGPVRLRAFGHYTLRIKDAIKFLREVVGTHAHFTTQNISDELRNMIVSRFTDVLGESRIPVLDLAANYSELGQFVMQRIQANFLEYGLELTQLLISSITLPPEVEKALDKRSSMGILGNLNQYAQYQAAEAMGKMAENSGGNSLAHTGVEMAMGVAMGNQLNNSLNAPPAASSAPPPLPGQAQFHVALNGQTHGPYPLETLRQYVQSGQINCETLVWKQGMAQWQAAAQVSELSSLFGGTMPPPIPPRAF
ncbi:SPFH domain-containing protein [Thioflexithrix psekupsensis]|uniref:Antifreeze protein n=1 Tax=Thioflexithrix psekupsensis TaxID=1570016 RepID=A0A251X4U5_9GAMM|nr:SPFH domain-containing protein [Thioflexithrix psekupsensis]OUD12375.1 antifreeze protein [Thioflexithrix psekupsensis]